MGLILLIVLIVILLGTVPAYPYSRGWGYRPAGGVSLLIAILVVLLLLNYLPWGFGPTPISP
jgi:hypothetical protein